MVSKLKKIIGALMLVVTHSTVIAAPIELIEYEGVSGSGLITFTGLGLQLPGRNYDSILSVNGVSFGERFAGQTLSTSGNFDVLSDTPSAPLTLVAGAANSNLVVILDGGVGSEVLAGLGPVGHPLVGAIGEGAFAVRFDRPQAEFGFRLAGVDGGTIPALATISFFRADGTSIHTLELELESLGQSQYVSYGFRRAGGVEDIAGFSVFNNDPGGIGFDDLKFTPRNGQPVPEPGSIALIGIALALLAGRRRA